MIPKQISRRLKVPFAAGHDDELMLVDRNLAGLRRSVEARAKVAVDVCVDEFEQEIRHGVRRVRR
ncbi:hypothetical protein SDC9_82241 [bioreactor metagenome]|uniref:Uncharacterized protein n=1 Tax=bioreactor metagenome TaxID=1076179 RepID=A0A644Z5T6_9ZZZZ